jgi:prepilin-type N-terminal cleavage/methylation domain-containing protein/prepilin-type processing-associated H-X9-DG protein
MRKNRGFTLIELLVVIAVIAIPPTILAPALHKTREHTIFIYCVANHSKQASAWVMYADANMDSTSFSFADGHAEDGWMSEPSRSAKNRLSSL